MGQEGFQLKNVNVGGEKIYSKTYQALKNEIKISNQYFEYYYNNNTEYSHFYTDEEIDSYKKMWKERIDAGLQ